VKVLNDMLSNIGWYRLSGVIVSVLTIGPKVHRFKPGRGNAFLRAIKIRTMSSFGGEVKPSAPCRKTLQYVKKSLRGMNTSKAKVIICFPKFLLICYYMILVVGLPESSGGRITFPLPDHSTVALYSYITWGMNNQPVGGRYSEK
jgi:hypothetical protein